MGERPGLIFATACQLSFEPAVHSRLVALVEDGSLLVVDLLNSLTPDSVVRHYFHFNFDDAAWDPDLCRARTSAENPGLLLYASEGLEGEFLAGKVSERLDITRPSLRLCLTSRGSAGSERAAAFLAVPFEKGSEPRVEGLNVERSEKCVTVGYNWNGVERRIVWDDGEVSGS